MLSQIFTLVIGLCLGFLPSLLWLVFWLREDPHPEPARDLIRAFVSGMCIVPGIIIFQFIALSLVSDSPFSTGLDDLTGFALIFVLSSWAIIEESFKLLGSEQSLVASDDDEPIDPVIYLMTTAAGFAAVENVLFIISPLFAGNFLGAALAWNSRFIGATMLHFLCSGIIGLALGYSFYEGKKKKLCAIMIGLSIASLLHAIFNGLIITSTSSGGYAFYFLWILVFALVILIHKLNRLKKT